MSDSVVFIFKVKPLNFSRENVDKFVGILVKEYPNVFLDNKGQRVGEEEITNRTERLYNNGLGKGIGLNIYEKGVSIEFIFEIENRIKDGFFFGLSTPEFYLYAVNETEELDEESKKKADQVARHTEYLLNYSRLIIKVFEPEYGVCAHELTLESDKFTDRVRWINYFSPEKVKKIGLDRILSAPVYKVEKLPNGGVLMMSSKYQGMAKTSEIEKHLGLTNGLE